MNRPDYIPTLDGWRAIAIAGVVLSHAFASDYWTRHGALGVNLFFAISGFLITSRLLDEQSSRGRISLSDFYVRRAFRILPPAFLYLGGVAVLTMLGVIYSSGKDLLSCLLFVRNYWGGDAHTGWYTGHFWSLAVEEQFYLFWPFLLVAVGRARAKWLAPALAIAFAVWRSLDLRHGWVATFFHQELLRNYPLRSDYRMDSLLWGSTLGMWGVQRFALKRWGSLAAVASASAILFLDAKQPQSYMVGEALLFPALLAITVANPATWMGKMLETKPMRFVGRLSYSLYLWQQLFVSQYHHGVLQRFPVNLVLALGCALGSFYLVERPAIRLGRRFTSTVSAPDSVNMVLEHDLGRTRPSVSPAARTGNCRPELSLTRRASSGN